MLTINATWFFLVASSIVAVSTSSSCNQRYYGGTSFVCVCSLSQQCDLFPPINRGSKGTFMLYTSNKNSLRFGSTSGNFSHQRFLFAPSITINRNETQQEIIGFGGAFTDAATKNILSLPASLQDDVLQAYFGPNGIEYNMGRVPVGGTDFSTHGYSYDDTKDADPELQHFKLAPEDLDWKIPVIQRVQSIQPRLQLLASAWTAPKWMKTNGNYTGGSIIEKYYQTWAEYYVKFFEEYEKHGISFWAVTTGNEPSLALSAAKINSVGWPLKNVKRWIEENFGPKIRNSSYNYLKIFVLDDQRFLLPWYPSYVLQDKAKEIVDGIAVHWYWDTLFPPFLLDMTHLQFPDKILLNTESCRGDKSWEAAVVLGDWGRAEDYAHGILQDLNHKVQGWIDWNLAVNMSGGPTYISNEVDAPIIVHDEAQEFYKQPIFYALGHFAKFLPQGARKIAHSTNADLELAAFQRPDKGIAVVILNRKRKAQTIMIHDLVSGYIELTLSSNSINTLLYW